MRKCQVFWGKKDAKYPGVKFLPIGLIILIICSCKGRRFVPFRLKPETEAEVK